MQALRDRWNEQSKNMARGGTPILTSGLKVTPWSNSGKDAETEAISRLSREEIATAYRIPLAVLGISGGSGGGTGGSYAQSEILMRQWISQGLGFVLAHVENALDATFGLTGEPNDYSEFDTGILLRSDAKSRMETLAAGVVGGI